MTSDDPIFAGIDIGASTAKIALIDRAGHLEGWLVERSGTDFTAKAESLLEQTLEATGIARRRIRGVVSTGYGRRNVEFADDQPHRN